MISHERFRLKFVELTFAFFSKAQLGIWNDIWPNILAFLLTMLADFQCSMFIRIRHIIHCRFIRACADINLYSIQHLFCFLNIFREEKKLETWMHT